jgi:hypothetical protein
VNKEKRDLYNSNKQLTGEFVYKGEKIPKDRYYLTVVIWIQNSKDEFLLQLTSPQKVVSGRRLLDIQKLAKQVCKELSQKLKRS